VQSNAEHFLFACSQPESLIKRTDRRNRLSSATKTKNKKMILRLMILGKETDDTILL